MSTIAKAADVIDSALPVGSHITKIFGERVAQTLADAGLLMPDPPAPDLSADDPKHQAKHRALWGGEAPNVWREGLPHELTLQTFPSDPDVTMYRDLEPEDLFSPDEARRLAYALLAAANHAEQQQ